MKQYTINATHWQGLSGYTSVAHLLTTHINAPHWDKLQERRAYIELLDAFRTLYCNPHLSWKEICELTNSLEHPRDQQLFWAFPLKKVLDKQLASQPLCDTPDPSCDRLPPEALSRLCAHLKIRLTLQYDDSAPKGWQKYKSRGYTKKAQLALNVLYIKHQWQVLSTSELGSYAHHLLWHYQKALHKVDHKSLFLQVQQLIRQRLSLYDPSRSVAIDFTTGAQGERLSLYDSSRFPDHDILLERFMHRSPQALARLACKANDPLEPELSLAILSGDTGGAIRLIQTGADIYAKNAQNVTPLHRACASMDVSILKAMIEREKKHYQRRSLWQRVKSRTYIDFTIKDKNDDTPVMYAARNANPELIRCVYSPMESGSFKLPLFLEINKRGESQFHVAAQNLNKAVLGYLLTKHRHDPFLGSFLARTDQMGFSVVHHAVLANRSDNIDLLARYTSLHGNGHRNKMKTFIAERLDKQIAELNDALKNSPQDQNTPNQVALLDVYETQKDELNSHLAGALTPFWLALELRHFNLLERLFKTEHTRYLTRRGLVTQTDYSGQNALHLAARYGKTEFIQFLHKKLGTSLPLEVPDREGNFPLHVAAKHGELATLKLLLSFKGTNVDTINPSGVSAYSLATQYKHKKIIKWLESQNAKKLTHYELVHNSINRAFPEEIAAEIATKQSKSMFKYRDKNNNTLLHHCVIAFNFKMLQVLLHPMLPAERQELIAVRNKEGITALQLVEQLKRMVKASSKKKESSRDNRKLQLKALEQIGSALLLNSGEMFKKLSKKEQLKVYCSYQLAVKQDIELTTEYNLVIKAMLIVPPSYAFFNTLQHTKSLWLSSAALLDTAFSGDTLDTLEKGISQAKPYMPEMLHRPADWAQTGFSYLGLYRKTTHRASAMMIRHGATALLNHHVSQRQQNYLTFLRYAGVMLGSSEAANTYIIAPQIGAYYQGIESVLNQELGVPTLNTLANSALQMAHSGIQRNTGVNVQRTLRGMKNWVKYNLAQQQRPEVYFDSTITKLITERLATDDSDKVNSILSISKALYVEHGDDSELYKHYTSGLVDLANTGKLNQNALNALQSSASLGSSENVNTRLSELLLNFAVPISEKLSTAQYETYTAELAKSLTELTVGEQPLELSAVDNILDKTNVTISIALSNINPGGTDAVNLYREALVQGNNDACDDGRAKYMLDQLIAHNPLVFKRLDPETYVEWEGELYKALDAGQGSNNKYKDNRIASTYDLLNTLLSNQFLVERIYRSDLDCSFAIPEHIANFNPIYCKAALIVSSINHFVMGSDGYNMLTPKGQIQLLNAVHDQMHIPQSHDQIQSGLNTIVYDALMNLAVNENDPLPLFNHISLDQAANTIVDRCSQAANNALPGTPAQFIQESNPEHSQFDRSVRSILNRLGQVTNDGQTTLGVGMTTDPQFTHLGAMNVKTGEMTGATYRVDHQAKPADLSSSSESFANSSINIHDSDLAQLHAATMRELGVNTSDHYFSNLYSFEKGWEAAYQNATQPADHFKEAYANATSQSTQNKPSIDSILRQRAKKPKVPNIVDELVGSTKDPLQNTHCPLPFSYNPSNQTGSNTGSSASRLGHQILNNLSDPKVMVALCLIQPQIGIPNAIRVGITSGVIRFAIPAIPALFLGYHASTGLTSNRFKGTIPNPNDSIFTFPKIELGVQDHLLQGKGPKHERVNVQYFPIHSQDNRPLVTPRDQPKPDTSPSVTPITPVSSGLFHAYNMFSKRTDSTGNTKKWTTTGRVKAAQLPREGKVRFVPPKDYKPENPLQKGKKNGYLDNFQNEWTKGPSRTSGEAFEWDIQLSEKGRQQLGWASRDNKHLNVSLKGRITHA